MSETVVSLAKKTPSGHAKTTTMGVIHHVLDLCSRTGQMGAITGPVGAGKSTAFDAYAEANEGAIVVVRMTKAHARVSGALSLVCRALGSNVPATLQAGRMVDLIVERMLSDGPIGGRFDYVQMLIIDEAQWLEDDALLTLGGIWDQVFHSGMQKAIVLGGTTDLAARWGNPKSTSFGLFAPLRGRFLLPTVLPGASEDDALAICDCEGIGSAEARNAVKRLVSMPGGLHNLRKLKRLVLGRQTEGAMPGPDVVRIAKLIETHEKNYGRGTR